MKIMTPRKIVEMRKRHGIRSAEKLAVILGLGISSVKRWEAGYTKPPKAHN